MSDKFTPPPPAEQSLKYLAWSIKEMNENIKRIAECLEKYFVQGNSVSPTTYTTKGKSASYKDDSEIPF